jgi:hypothetical protein
VRQSAQSIGAGTVGGRVVDQSGAVIVGAVVTLQNSATNYRHQSVRTDENGAYRFNNVPLNSYHLSMAAPGFAKLEQDVAVRSTVPLTQDVTIQIEGPQTTTIDVTGAVQHPFSTSIRPLTTMSTRASSITCRPPAPACPT